MRDVTLVPKCDVFERRRYIGTHHPREPGEVLAQHRVALVRHGGRALLAFQEELGFHHLGTLQVADLRREPLHR